MSTVWSSIGPTGAGTAAAIGALVIGGVVRPRVTRPARRLIDDSPTTYSRATSNGPFGWRTIRTIIGVAASLVGILVLGVVVAVFVIATALLVRRLAPLGTARRQRALVERALPDAMDLLVLSVRAGLTPYQAVCDLARSRSRSSRSGSDPDRDAHAAAVRVISDAFGEVVRRTERGQPFADALSALPERLGTQAGGLADVIATSDRHGLPIGPVLDQLAGEVRSTRRRLDQADARKLPIRLSFPLVVCTLPSFVLLAIAPAVIAALSSLGATAW